MAERMFSHASLVEYGGPVTKEEDATAAATAADDDDEDP